MFEDRMVTSAIPERVYALCQAVKSRGMAENKLRELLEPSDLGGKTKYFGSVRDAAKQLGLISDKEGEISLLVDKKSIDSISLFRKSIITNIDSVENGLFYAVSQEYFNLGDKIYKYSSVSDKQLVEYMTQSVGKAVYEDDMRAWRFWAAFLGFGHLQGMMLLPNVAQYLREVISLCGMNKNREYSMSEFITMIKPYCGIILGTVSDDHILNMAFSNGLRVLHDEGEIILQHKLDRGDMWFLYKAELHGIQSTVTHITIGGKK